MSPFPTDPDVNVSAHTAPIVRPLHAKASNAQTDPVVSSRYDTTTDLLAGTLPLVGLPLVVLPYHRSDRFPRSTPEPESSSRHLHAGGRLVSTQDSTRLIPE